jgi:hypothetical protein
MDVTGKSFPELTSELVLAARSDAPNIVYFSGK